MNLSFTLLLVNVVVFVGASEDWCYTGCENSPSRWGDHYEHCNGNRQSPINIDTKQVINNKNLQDFNLANFTKKDTMKNLTNNGHTVKCELEPGIEVSGGGLNDDYSTLQFHFHWGEDDLEHFPGSEHSINGHRYPMEMHIVSLKKGLNPTEAKANSEGISVLGFFIDVKEEIETGMPEVWERFSEAIPASGANVALSLDISIQDLLLDVDLTKYYRYHGSLTTPGCNEAVVWTVFQQPIRISKDLILRFTQNAGFTDVYRPQQSLHDRTVYGSSNLGATTPPSEGHEWCYEGCDHALSHWGDISGASCKGENQSPINIDSHNATYKPSLGHFSFFGFSDSQTMDYLINNGHTVNAVLKNGKVEVAGGGLEEMYTTVQFHFHWGNSSQHGLSGEGQSHRSTGSSHAKSAESHETPSSGGGSGSGGSEHAMDSHVYPMEMHIVSMKKGLTAEQAQKDPTAYAVLGFFIEATDDNDQPGIWKNFTDHLQMIQNIGSTIDLHQDISLDALLGNVDRTKYYRYKGSLTTPSCNEAVIWTIFKEPIKVSKNLVEKFSTETGLNNVFRSVQPLHNRVVYTTEVSSNPPSSPTPSSSPTCLFSLVLILSSLCATLWINQRQ
ncbi:carbonic anhydrase-like [Clupea harengus]|uniref:Carbonic anhydrase n=1 Tax=Clupea harengus TaxID=7950 RepID=A0A6P3WBL8_CLUHA|nr:carbonic anhydrase-like [Clupea harengus]XP_031417093.1 carbonic anhydrase-like [Clupea harengus]